MFWAEFAILFVLALGGSAAVLPYGLRLAGGAPPRLSLPVVLLLSLLQNAALFGVVTSLGLLAAHATGFGAPYLEAMLAGTALPNAGPLAIALALGLCLGAALTAGDFLFEPSWPAQLRQVTLQTTLRENLLASLYGGINEELLLRLFGFSGLAWLVSLVPPGGLPSVPVLWLINVVTTVLFAVGHLPALKRVAGGVSRPMLIRTLALNAPVGLACGWLFWTSGLEAAMLAHFAADIVYHGVGTILLRKVVVQRAPLR